MAGGVYGAQRLVFDASKTSPDDVVFQPAPGATVVVRGFTSGSSFSAGDGAKHFTVKGIQIVGDDGRQTHLVAFAGTNDMTLIDIDASNFYLNGVKNVLVKGGDWGPCLNFRDNWSIDRCSNSKIDGNSAPYGNENVTIDGAYFHDYRILLGSGAHFECVFLNGGTNITIRNSRFANCAFYDIFVARRTGDPFNGLTIENNWFDTPWNEAPGGAAQARDGAIAFSHGGDLTEPWRNVLVRFNSFHASTGISYNEDGGAITTSNNRIVGNIMESQTCVSAIWTYSFNLVNGVTCSPTDRAIGASFPYVNGAHLHVGGNWHLSGGVAVDFVLTGILDALLDTDIDGQLRPQGLARDAGADEFG